MGLTCCTVCTLAPIRCYVETSNVCYYTRYIRNQSQPHFATIVHLKHLFPPLCSPWLVMQGPGRMARECRPSGPRRWALLRVWRGGDSGDGWIGTLPLWDHTVFYCFHLKMLHPIFFPPQESFLFHRSIDFISEIFVSFFSIPNPFFKFAFRYSSLFLPSFDSAFH